MNVDATIDKLINSVSFNERKLDREEWLTTRMFPTCQYRMILIYILCNKLNSNGKISYLANKFHKNHATILHSQYKIRDMIDLGYDDIIEYHDKINEYVKL